MSALTPEGKVKERVKAILKARGVWYCMPMGTAWGRRGIPDFIACVAGKFFAIETKAGKGRTTKLQEYEMGRIRDGGGTALVVRENSLEDFERWIDEAMSATSRSGGR